MLYLALHLPLRSTRERNCVYLPTVNYNEFLHRWRRNLKNMSEVLGPKYQLPKPYIYSTFLMAVWNNPACQEWVWSAEFEIDSDIITDHAIGDFIVHELRSRDLRTTFAATKQGGSYAGGGGATGLTDSGSSNDSESLNNHSNAPNNNLLDKQAYWCWSARSM